MSYKRVSHKLRRGGGWLLLSKVLLSKLDLAEAAPQKKILLTPRLLLPNT